MFKEPLYNAIVRGNKTQTRRVVKVKEKGLNNIKIHGHFKYPGFNGPHNTYWFDISGEYNKTESVRKTIDVNPRYQIGETVYLKEPYQLIYKSWDSSGEPLELDFIEYRYDRENLDPDFIWKNKMFMPEKYARRFIKITNIRVERLQDISDYDILKEGVPHQNGMTLKEQWKFLWDSINKYPFNWAINPWNWVYEFELTEKP